MTGTSVKDVGSALMNLPVSQGNRSQAGTGSFQKIWNEQMNKGTAQDAFQNSTVRENASVSVKKETQDSQAAENKESQPVQKSAENESENVQTEDTKVQETEESVSEGAKDQNTVETEEIAVDGQEEAMEVLNTTAWNLMQQIAEAFGIDLEELQAVMGDLEMDQLDVLDTAKLGKLLLSLGGAEDSYALIMDEGLYEKYQMLMTQRAEAVSECAEKLETEPDQLLTLLGEEPGEEQVQEEVFVVEKAPVTEEDGDGQTEAVLPADNRVKEDVSEEQRAGRQSQEQPEREGHHPEGKTDRGDPVNLFTQNIRTQFQPEVQQTGEVPQNLSWSNDTRQIMDQIMDYMKLQLSADTTNLEMQLHPASLGTLQIQLVSKGGMVTANFIAQNEAVKAALETQIVQLREQFEEQGVKVEAIEVTVQSHEFERNLEQGRGRDPQETEKRGRGRRVHLSGRVAGEDTGEADEPAADLMTTGGSTVSYSA